MPAARAKARPGASARLLITAAIRAGQPSAAQARTIASMFEPRPEIRMTMFFIGARECIGRPARANLQSGALPTSPAP